MSFSTLKIRSTGSIYWVKFDREQANQAINGAMIKDLHRALDGALRAKASVFVIEGDEVNFCSGADLHEMTHGEAGGANPEDLFDFWTRMTNAPIVAVSHVTGRVTAGGLGFLGASDIVIAAPLAQFTMSELLIGLMPALITPFLMRRIGQSGVRLLAFSASSVDANRAREIGLVDLVNEDSKAALHRFILRAGRIAPDRIATFKQYLNLLASNPSEVRSVAIAANRRSFSDPEAQSTIRRFLVDKVPPWAMASR